jgi:hypothetical protein
MLRARMHECPHKCIQTHTRARTHVRDSLPIDSGNIPPMTLQAGWSFPVDVWAVGCIVVELVTGQQLFELAHDDVHLAMMERVSPNHL